MRVLHRSRFTSVFGRRNSLSPHAIEFQAAAARRHAYSRHAVAVAGFLRWRSVRELGHANLLMRLAWRQEGRQRQRFPLAVAGAPSAKSVDPFRQLDREFTP